MNIEVAERSARDKPLSLLCSQSAAIMHNSSDRLAPGFVAGRKALDQLSGKSNVTTGFELLKPRLDLVRELKRGDETAHRLAVDRTPTGQFLETFVGIFQSMAAHHGLHRLGQHLPGAVGLEVGGNPGTIELDPLEPAPERVQGDHQMTERGAERTHCRTVAQVTLPPRDRQLGRQMLKQR